MGYYLELRAASPDVVEVDEVKRRLNAAGCEVHPEYGEPDYVFEFGILTLNAPEKIRAGQWGVARLPGVHGSEYLEQFVRLAEQIGGVVYDTSILKSCITRETLEQSIRALRDAERTVIKSLDG